MQMLHHLSHGADSPLHPHILAMPGLAPGTQVPCVGMLLHDDLVEELQSPSLQQDVQNHKYWWSYFSAKELGNSEQVFNGMKVDRDLFGKGACLMCLHAHCAQNAARMLLHAMCVPCACMPVASTVSAVILCCPQAGQ
jgi:hypothetical protein